MIASDFVQQFVVTDARRARDPAVFRPDALLSAPVMRRCGPACGTGRVEPCNVGHLWALFSTRDNNSVCLLEKVYCVVSWKGGESLHFLV